MTESIAVSEIFASKGQSGKDGIIIIKRIVPKLKKAIKDSDVNLLIITG